MNRAEVFRTADLGHVLARVLATTGDARVASAAQIRVFRETIDTGDMAWSAWCCRRGKRETALAMLLYLPGDTALLLLSEPAPGGAAAGDGRALVAVAVREAFERQSYYVQALIEPEAQGKSKCLADNEFRRLTDLVYMDRAAGVIRRAEPLDESVTWIAYGPRTHEAFGRVIEATYAESLDCPELLGLRPIEAVIASHKAAGRFEPSLWEIACIGGEHAGCILTAPLIGLPTLEVVYMGVVPAWRRKGVGRALLARSLVHAQAVGARQQTIVVDARNAPARQLYVRAGFKPVALRGAWIRRGPRCGRA